MSEWATKDLWLVLIKNSAKEQLVGYGDRAKSEGEVIKKAAKVLGIPKERLVAVRWDDLEKKKDFVIKTMRGK